MPSERTAGWMQSSGQLDKHFPHLMQAPMNASSLWPLGGLSNLRSPAKALTAHPKADRMPIEHAPEIIARRVIDIRIAACS